MSYYVTSEYSLLISNSSVCPSGDVTFANVSLYIDVVELPDLNSFWFEHYICNFLLLRDYLILGREWCYRLVIAKELLVVWEFCLRIQEGFCWRCSILGFRKLYHVMPWPGHGALASINSSFNLTYSADVNCPVSIFILVPLMVFRLSSLLIFKLLHNSFLKCSYHLIAWSSLLLALIWSNFEFLRPVNLFINLQLSACLHYSFDCSTA